MAKGVHFEGQEYPEVLCVLCAEKRKKDGQEPIGSDQLDDLTSCEDCREHLYKKENEFMAGLLKSFLQERSMWEDTDTMLYYNGKCEYAKNGAIEEGVDVREFNEYANPDTVTLSFDGSPLYDALNNGDYNSLTHRYSWDTTNKLDELLKEHGFYQEMGHAWNLTLYKIRPLAVRMAELEGDQ